jgi:hypothetical protein
MFQHETCAMSEQSTPVRTEAPHVESQQVHDVLPHLFPSPDSPGLKSSIHQVQTEGATNLVVQGWISFDRRDEAGKQEVGAFCSAPTVDSDRLLLGDGEHWTVGGKDLIPHQTRLLLFMLLWIIASLDCSCRIRAPLNGAFLSF